MTDDPLARIHMQVMWNRLISVVEEQAQALLRTAFGSVAREAGDLSAGVYDLKGRMLAQAVTGTPGHVNSMAAAVAHFLEKFPIEEMKEGDVYTTNDPWKGTGHLFDFVVVTPAFLDGRLVALFASTCHLVDVGGRGFTADARSVYEEGIFVPHTRLFDDGTLNEPLMELIANNVREPIEVKGDLLALVSCNDTGCRRMIDMMREFEMTSIDDLAEHILVNSHKAMVEAIGRVPNGNYDAEMTLDGYEEPVRLKLRMVVEDERIILDYTGSTTASGFGINSPKCYTDAYSIFGLKCIIGPEIPNNAGSLAPMIVEAEAGSIVHPTHPSPVTARHVVGQMLPDIVFGCLDQAIEGGVQAESAGSIWVLAASGGTREGNSRPRFPQALGPFRLRSPKQVRHWCFVAASCCRTRPDREPTVAVSPRWSRSSLGRRCRLPFLRRPSIASTTLRGGGTGGNPGRRAPTDWWGRSRFAARPFRRCRLASDCMQNYPAAVVSATRWLATLWKSPMKCGPVW